MSGIRHKQRKELRGGESSLKFVMALLVFLFMCARMRSQLKIHGHVWNSISLYDLISLGVIGILMSSVLKAG